MKVLRLIVAASLFASPAQAQVAGSVTLNGGTANPPIPDLSMCLTPPTTFAHVWWVDPVNGHTASGGGTGSQSSPWNSLQALFTTVSGYSGPLLTSAPGGVGPVAPGDEILLNSGAPSDYGDITIPSNVANSSFVTIAAAPGQTPQLQSFQIGANDTDFAFSNLRLQRLKPSFNSGWLVAVNQTGTAALPSHDIYFDHFTVTPAPDATVATWSQAQWTTNSGGAFFLGNSSVIGAAYCVNVTNSLMTHMSFTMGLYASNSIIKGNEVSHFADDGTQYAANNLVVQGNYYHDHINTGDGNHNDGFQGFGIPTYYHDILFDSNTLLFQTDPNIPFASPATAKQTIFAAPAVNVGGSGYNAGDTITLADGAVVTVSSAPGGVVATVTVPGGGTGSVANSTLIPSNPMAQVSTSGSGAGASFNATWTTNVQYNNGIGEGNKDWTRLNMTNNIVTWPNNGLGLDSCHDCIVSGNTVLPAWNYYSAALTATPINILPKSPEGQTNTNVVVRNNYTAVLSISDPTAFVDNNVLSMSIVPAASSFLINGSPAFFSSPGTYSNGAFGTNNLVDSVGVTGEIAAFSNIPPTFNYDFRLLSTAPARGYGTSTTPNTPVDIDGLQRAPAWDVGAHVFH